MMIISILEDEVLLAKNISKKLTRSGYVVNIYNTVESFKDNFDEKTHLFIIDITLTDGTGFEAIDWIRNKKRHHSPVIITSWYNDIDNKIFGLHIGADDYLPKPFEPDELLARIKALIRRSFHISSGNELSYKNYVYNVDNKRMFHDGIEINLSRKEQALVEYFMVNQGKLISKNVLVTSIWGAQDSLGINDNTINVTIARLRRKLWENFNLATVVGNGYSLKA